MTSADENVMISSKLAKNTEILSERLGIGFSFDILLREISLGGKNAALVFLDGFNDTLLSTLIMQTLLKASRDEVVPNTLEKLVKMHLPYVDVDTVNTIDDAIDHILAGPMVLFIEGENQALVIDTRNYPGRDPEEPDIEKVTRGSRDGFVETMLFNVSLVRRRIRDPRLRCEALKAGRRSKTDITLMYIQDITSPVLIDNVRRRIEAIDIDALPMAEKTVEEFICRGFWNPFPQVRYTERPDVAAVHILEGHVIVIVDTSPSVMIAPVTIFHHIQHAEEFRQDPIVGVYIRWVRLLGILISFLLVPLWLLFVLEPQLLPPFLDFLGPEEDFKIPLMLQFIIAHFGIDLLRMASIHTPSPLATALGLVGGLLIGQIAVDVGFFVPEVLLYMGLVAIGIFSTPSWELGMANRVILLMLILLTGIFRLPGFLAGMLIVLIRLFTTWSFGFPYLWPLWPLNVRALVDVMARKPLPKEHIRPSNLHTRDKDRTPK